MKKRYACHQSFQNSEQRFIHRKTGHKPFARMLTRRELLAWQLLLTLWKLQSGNSNTDQHPL
jgi:hypothetical protein